MTAGVPRLLVPTLRRSLAVCALAAVGGAMAGIGNLGAPSYSDVRLPALTITLTRSAAASGPVLSAGQTEVSSSVVRADDLLPLSRDLVLDEAYSGPADNRLAATAWPDGRDVAGRLDGWGRTEGLRQVYVSRGPTSVDAAVMQVAVDLATYRTAKGALDALTELGNRLTKLDGSHLPAAAIGDGAVTLRVQEGSVATLHVLFRKGSATGWLAVTGEAAALKAEAVERLAASIASRIG